MEPLYKRELYGEPTALDIELMGSTAISIANRWALGWPDRVESLLENYRYLGCLREQTEREKDVLAETVSPHLSHAEIMRLNGVPESPPFFRI